MNWKALGVALISLSVTVHLSIVVLQLHLLLNSKPPWEGHVRVVLLGSTTFCCLTAFGIFVSLLFYSQQSIDYIVALEVSIELRHLFSGDSFPDSYI